IRVPAPRGRILDRSGKEIVVNRPSFDVYVLPDDVKDPQYLAGVLSPILGMEAGEIKDKITKALRENRFRPTLIAQDINRDQLAFIEARKSRLQAVLIEINHVRKYPHGTLGSGFLGYLGMANEAELKLYPKLHNNDVVGKSGVEKNWETFLRGEDGFVQRVTDAVGREVKNSLFHKDLQSLESVPGADIVLSIDLDLQKAAEDALGEMKGAAIAINVKTGEVLALASHPNFDPSDFARGIQAKKWKELLEDPTFPLINRATQGLYAPGSVFKIVTAAAGLKEGVIDTNTRFYCPGSYTLGRKTFKCWKKGGHGTVNLHRAIVQSCDVYFYNVAERLGIDRFAFHIKSFGFGSPTGIDLSERAGIAPSREWKLKAFKAPWYSGETVVAGIGQGYVSVSPLQIAVMTATVANGGRILKPQIVKKVVSPEGNVVAVYGPEIKGRLPIDEKMITAIKDGLKAVVNEGGGTGRASRLDEMLVAGKTGTAQVISQTDNINKDEHKDHAWFTAYAPADDAEIAVTVLVENGGKGGSVAAPRVRQILEAYLKLKKEGNV
ncbi:MAG TPA: penicillin-binding protein 2, partial [Thermodesulfobacteriota bacterium]|nr:penicillin-binding protein 2 [Thermodesulfobacteriota bacterium]